MHLRLILFHKIVVQSNTSIFKPVLHLTGAQFNFLFYLSSQQSKEPNISANIKIRIYFVLSCPPSNIPLFKSNSEDQDMPLDDNEQERDDSEATSLRIRMDLQHREVMVQTQRDLELFSRRRSISGAYHKIWQATQMIIQKTISQKKMSKREF